MRVALLPLDDRPCHTRFPLRLAQAAGIELLLPPRELLGWFDRPGDPGALLDWLAEVAPRVDGMGACVEMLTCGGLVASRRPDSTAHEVAARVERLASILRTARGPAHLGSIVMRATVTVTGEDAVAAYTLVARYSELREAADGGDPDAAAEVRSIADALPPGVLDSYLQARRRNHWANLACLDLVATGAARSLILTREDCRARGIHRAEQRALLSRAAGLGLEPGREVLVHPGADELSAVLVARVAAEVSGHRPSARVTIVPSGSADRIAPFEDAPIRETAAGQALAAGLTLTEEADAPRLVVIGPLATPAELSGDDAGWAAAEEDASWLGELAQVAGDPSGGAVVVADAAVANGAYMPAFDALWASPIADRCHAYVAWNTAGNTLGTATAILSLLPLMQRPMEQLRRFRLERLLDDVAYQSIVRSRLTEWVRSRGEDPHRMTPSGAGSAEQWVARELPQAAEALGAVPAGLPWRIALPWDRTFECDVELAE